MKIDSFRSVQLWFIVLTALYWAGSILIPGQWLEHLLGLFVPIGPGNFTAIEIIFLQSMGTIGIVLGFVIPLAIVLIACWAFEKWMKRYQLGFLMKMSANLFFLLVLTLFFDLLIFHTWASLILLQNGTFLNLQEFGK